MNPPRLPRMLRLPCVRRLRRFDAAEVENGPDNMIALDESHDPARRSWVEEANLPDAEFPVQNLPFGMFRTERGARLGVAIGNSILDLVAVAALLEDVSGMVAECEGQGLGPLIG